MPWSSDPARGGRTVCTEAVHVAKTDGTRFCVPFLFPRNRHFDTVFFTGPFIHENASQQLYELGKRSGLWQRLPLTGPA